MTDIVDLLRLIGLRGAREAIDAWLAHAAKTRLSPAQTCEELVALELREREMKNLARRTATATLGSFKTLDKFDWNHPRSIDRELYEEALTLDFLCSEPRQNIIFRGPPGVGKTTLSQNIGQRALEKGFTVRFSTLPAALADLLRQESIPATERRLKRYTDPDLLILDELGYVPCDSRAADLFFHIVSRRHERRSMIISTNLAFKQWGSVFQDASCLGALIDRFAQHCIAIDIDADSWRQRDDSPSGTPRKYRKRRS